MARRNASTGRGLYEGIFAGRVTEKRVGLLEWKERDIAMKSLGIYKFEVREKRVLWEWQLVSSVKNEDQMFVLKGLAVEA